MWEEVKNYSQIPGLLSREYGVRMKEDLELVEDAKKKHLGR